MHQGKLKNPKETYFQFPDLNWNSYAMFPFASRISGILVH